MSLPDEIAALVVFLCRREAHNLTGAAIPVDGGLLTSFYDLTVRRRAEKALRETQEQLARAIEASGVAFWEW